MYLLIQKQPLEVLSKKGVLKNFAKFTGKQMCQSLFFNKVAGLILIKKDSGTRVFLWILQKNFKAPFLNNTSRRKLLPIIKSV